MDIDESGGHRFELDRTGERTPAPEPENCITLDDTSDDEIEEDEREEPVAGRCPSPMRRDTSAVAATGEPEPEDEDDEEEEEEEDNELDSDEERMLQEEEINREIAQWALENPDA